MVTVTVTLNSLVSLASPMVMVAVSLTTVSAAGEITVASSPLMEITASLSDAQVITASFKPATGSLKETPVVVTSRVKASLASATFSASVF